MKNEKQAFILPLLGALAPIAGGIAGQSLAARYLTPNIRKAAVGALTSRRKAQAAAQGLLPGFENMAAAPTAIGKRYDKALNWLGKRRKAQMVGDNVGFGVGGMAAMPLMGMAEPQQELPKYANEIFTGFMKAAEESGVSDKAISTLFKKAFSNENLTPDDVAKIRLALQEQGVSDPYSDPYGPSGANYNQNLLRARDRSLDEVPELSAGSTAARKGLMGAAFGGAGGYALGSLLNSPGVLGSKVPYGMRTRLPIGLGTSGAVVGALINALPAYKRRIDEIKGLQKLNSPENMNRLLSSVQMDKAILNS